MQSSSVPAKFPAVWGYAQTSTYLQAVPTLYNDVPGTASLQFGFGQETFQPIDAGGTGPRGEYVNGLFQQVTANIQWQQAGGWYSYDATLSTAIGGYPKRALLINAAGTGFWISTAENNTTNPDGSSPAGWAVLQPNSYPWSSITGAPTFVLASEFASPNVQAGVNGYRKDPSGQVEQWCEYAVTGGGSKIITISFPIAFPNSANTPRVSATNPTATNPSANNFIGVTVISHTLTNCTVAIGSVPSGSGNFSVLVDVRGT